MDNSTPLISPEWNWVEYVMWRWMALLCSTCLCSWPPPTFSLKWGACRFRWSWSVLPQTPSWFCAHPVLTDGTEGNAVDLQWPRPRGVPSQQQTISIISRSPGAIIEAALQHCVVESMWLTDSVHLIGGARQLVDTCSLDLMNARIIRELTAETGSSAAGRWSAH